MATTTNFGWETPDDTDLVKDGAAAMRTLGGAIDTSLVDLKGGTQGQFLAKNSATDMDFIWRDAPGKVLQVVYGSTSTTVTSTSTTYADTGLTATITPSATTSKILVIATQSLQVSRAAPAVFARLQLMRGSTVISELGSGSHKQIFGVELSTEAYVLLKSGISTQYLDSPSTTSATTYKFQGGVGQQPGGATWEVKFQQEQLSTIILMEIGA